MRFGITTRLENHLVIAADPMGLQVGLDYFHYEFGRMG